MTEDLYGLAKKLGIATAFSDGGLVRREYEVSPDIIRFFIRAFGYKAGSESEIAASLQKAELQRWQRALEPVYICQQSEPVIDFVTFADRRQEDMQISLINSDSGQPAETGWEILKDDESMISGLSALVKIKIRLTGNLPVGYYDLKLRHHNKTYRSRLALAPTRCYEPAAMERKIWGFSIQLYSIKSLRNWGVGDFSDLKSLTEICSEVGADIIGLNPLNTLAHDFPENASPYQSVSRLFLNPIYIDVEQLPEFTEEDAAEVHPLLEDLRGSELIRYQQVYDLKMTYLRRAYQRFLSAGDTPRRQAFEAFCQAEGEDLNRLAAFQTLYHHFCQTVWGGWRAWPEAYRNPESPAVAQFVRDHAEAVGFFKFLQFEADRQYMAAAALSRELGLGVGYYRDLAVGVGKDSAELWSNPGLFIKDAAAGAPPDVFFPAGQKWGLGAFDPYTLKEQGYQPFIKILRANMRGAGALRIDHVMSLMRLYVLPDKADGGTYIYYNLSDMLNIVALESELNRCAVVGESIGNVPEGFLDILQERNIHSLSVLWAERHQGGWGDFRAPECYPPAAFASIGTHDMAPLKMWWFGYDIELSASLGLIASEQEKADAYHKRENDRWKLLCALDCAGVWPQDNCRRSNYLYGEGYPEGLEEVVHRYLSRAASRVVLVQPEDILQVEKMQNLPGTDRDKHPNWRRKLPLPLEELRADIAFLRSVEALRQER